MNQKKGRKKRNKNIRREKSERERERERESLKKRMIDKLNTKNNNRSTKNA